MTNPVPEEFPGLEVGHTTSAAERIVGALPGARVVQAFGAVFA